MRDPFERDPFEGELVKRLHREMESFLAVEIDELYAVAAVHAFHEILMPKPHPRSRYKLETRLERRERREAGCAG